MSAKKSTWSVWVALLVVSAAVMSACNKSGNVTASADGGKIPVTTASDEARKEFLAGRDLSERLLGQESLQHFDKALALDPEFALAELGRANNSPTAKEFFEHLKKASALAPKASNGEKLLILANQAGANGVTEIQKEYLDQLTAGLSERRTGTVQPGELPLRAAGTGPGVVALQEGGGTGSELFAGL